MASNVAAADGFPTTLRHNCCRCCWWPQVYGCVRMDDFLAELAKRVQRNTTSMEIFGRLWTPPAPVPSSAEGSPLQTKVGLGAVRRCGGG